MNRKPYTLVLGSHKGGTGRTTCALALAYLWGQSGLNVTLIDADPVGAARLVALDGDGICHWEGVRFFAHLPDSSRDLQESDLVLIDAPPLTERSAQRVLRQAESVIVTSLADPLSLRTIPRAVAAIQQAQSHNSKLSLLGLVIGNCHEQNRLQKLLLQQLRRSHSQLLLEPAICYQREVSDWATKPGSPLPEGPAKECYQALANRLETMFFPLAALPGRN